MISGTLSCERPFEIAGYARYYEGPSVYFEGLIFPGEVLGLLEIEEEVPPSWDGNCRPVGDCLISCVSV